MNILYLSLSYLPSRRASSVQVMKTCAALRRAGHDVALVAKRGPAVELDDHAYFDVAERFVIRKLARPRWKGGGVVYAAEVAGELVRRRAWADVVFCRDPVAAIMALGLGCRVVFEAHEIPARPAGRAMLKVILRGAARVVAISSALARDLREVAPPRAEIVVAPDACDVPPSRGARSYALHTPPTIGYVGGLYPGRGVERIVEVAARLPGCRFVLVGGADQDLAFWRSQTIPPNVEFRGFVRQAALAREYEAFDVVLMPYAKAGVLGPSKSVDTSRWASPMKMFEYMASGVPLVSTDLPVLREVLTHEENCLFVEHDTTDAWTAAVERLLADHALRATLAQRAARDVLDYSWDARVARLEAALALS